MLSAKPARFGAFKRSEPGGFFRPPAPLPPHLIQYPLRVVPGM